MSSRTFVPGFLILPLEFYTNIGLLSSVKNFFFLYETFKTSFAGIPQTSIIIANCSISSSPGKRGNPIQNSAIIHPNDHISIDVVYGIPRMISGAL